MTDTKESNYQDVADLRAENAKLRAEVDFANERAGRAEHELAALRQQAEAAAPSDAEIEAWERKYNRDMTGAQWVKDGVALMRRAKSAPAASGALREAIQLVVDWNAKEDARPPLYTRLDMLRRAFAAEPPAPSAAAGVAVPEDVRKKAGRITIHESGIEAYDCARFILSLSTAAGASQPEPAAQGDAELQRLLDEAKRRWMSPNEKCILTVVAALARKAGCK